MGAWPLTFGQCDVTSDGSNLSFYGAYDFAVLTGRWRIFIMKYDTVFS